ncbi:hypothetical protein PoB_000574000 [Plakobranchus ocellatus]|uniref:Uncharacterized protein n=1 Tax=Plakobranchus ocellatus TaxID=259542 RepID=A0AAV3Y7Y3_9GAST|nr:hypothetical protein PoB_000574000 [Plakobranchus ocellatus]
MARRTDRESLGYFYVQHSKDYSKRPRTLGRKDKEMKAVMVVKRINGPKFLSSPVCYIRHAVTHAGHVDLDRSNQGGWICAALRVQATPNRGSNINGSLPCNAIPEEVCRGQRALK